MGDYEQAIIKHELTRNFADEAALITEELDSLAQRLALLPPSPAQAEALKATRKAHAAMRWRVAPAKLAAE